MAYYNNYFPQQYYAGANMPYNAPNLNSNAQAQQNNQITWVQGEAAAKAYPVGAGNSVLLMDSEESVFYIKSTDQTGMPQPLRIFDYSERKSPNSEQKAAQEQGEFITRSEFEDFSKSIKRTISELQEQAGEG